MAVDSESKKFLQEALDELKEGQEAISVRQKHIRIADQSEYQWRTVEAYKVGGLGDNDEDAKRIKEAERDVAQRMSRDKRKPSSYRERRLPPLPPLPPMMSQWAPGMPQFPQPMPLPPLPHSAPPRQPGFYKPPGPCFNCYEMGHLKANCPRLKRPQYPLYTSYVNAIDNVCGDMSVHGEMSTNSSKPEVTVCGDMSSYNACATVCGNMANNNACVSVCGEVPSCSHNNVCATVCENVTNSSCSNLYVSYDVVKVTACEMVSSNHYATDSGTVAVNSTSMVNVVPKVTSVFTSTGPNGGPCKAAVCQPLTMIPPEARSASCSSGAAPTDTEMHNLTDPTIASATPDVDPDGSELHNPNDVHMLTAFWEVEEGSHQVTDVQGCLYKSLSFWENTLDPAPWIVSCIKEGYKLPLRSIPDWFRRPNQQSALNH